jgi:hypothetical protein
MKIKKLVFLVIKLFFGAGLMGLLFFFYLNQPYDVLLESIESKTNEGNSVYNKISFAQNQDQDIWYMQQSHKKGEWDQLKIVVDKTQNPKRAYYYQYKNNQEVKYRVSCFLCHANGPRAIRPNWESKEVNNNIKDKMVVALWNLKIKTYGKIITPQNQHIDPPLKYSGKLDTTPLQIKTCQRCHGSENIFGRSALLRQQAGTMLHLVERGEMPPWPYKMSSEEKKYLKEFAIGMN